MNTTDYLLNGLFLLVVLRQARERRLDARSVVVPLVMLVFVGQQYLHSLPTAGNDLLLIGALATVGLALGTVSGLTTHVRAGDDGYAHARVGWLAGILLVLGISSRLVFAFAIAHGFEPTVASFSIANNIGAAAWPVALVLMAMFEVSARIAIVQLRGRQVMAGRPAAVAAAA